MKKGFRWAMLVLLATGIVLSLSLGVTAEEAVTIKVWMGDTEEDSRNFFDSVARTFEAGNSGIKIAIEYMDTMSFMTKLRAAAAAKQMPDVLRIYGAQWIYGLGNMGLLLPLDKYLDLTRFASGVLSPWEAKSKPEFKGQILAVPFTVRGSYGIGYNKDIFAKYKIAVPHTWGQYLGVLKALKSKGIVPESISGRNANSVAMGMGDRLAAIKKDVLAYEKLFIDKTLSFQDPGVIEAMTMFKEQAQYFGPGWENYDYPEVLQLFYQGRLAIGPGDLGYIRYIKANFPDLKYGLFGPLTYKGVTFKTKGGAVESFSIISSSQHKDEAIRFVQYLMSDEVMVKHFLDIGGLPGVKGILTRKEIVAYLAKEPQMKEAIRSAYDNLRPDRIVDWGNQEIALQTKFGEGLVAIGLGLKTVSQVATELEATRQTLIKGK